MVKYYLPNAWHNFLLVLPSMSVVMGSNPSISGLNEIVTLVISSVCPSVMVSAMTEDFRDSNFSDFFRRFSA